MKKLLLLIPLLFILMGCGMTNEEIITEAKKCEDAGMKTDTVISGFSYSVIDIICVPKDSGFLQCPVNDKKVVDIKIECADGKSGCTDIYYFEDGSVCKD